MAKRKSPADAENRTVTETVLSDTVLQDRKKVAKRTKTTVYEPTDEFQQVTNEEYIRRHRVLELGYGADVLAQDHVGRAVCVGSGGRLSHSSSTTRRRMHGTMSS